MTLGIIGIFLGIFCLIFGAFNRVGALPMSLLATLVIALTSGLDVWDAFSNLYMNGFASAFVSYFLIFSFSCLYSKLMDVSGSAAAISYKLLDICGKKNVMTTCCIISGVLCYGGVSGFVITFLLAPIMFTLFREADIPRHLCIGPVMFGCATWVMGCMPGSTQLSNVIPSQFLGTSLTAGWWLGLLASAALIAMHLIYLNRQVKLSAQRGEHFTYPAGTDASRYQFADRSQLPPVWKAFLPLVLLIVIIIVGSLFIKNSTMLTVVTLAFCSLVCFIINFDRLKGKDPKGLITSGLGDGFTAISSMAAILGMGAVITSTPAYMSIVDWILALGMNPYIKGAVSTALISSIVGTSAGGLRLTLNSLGGYFTAAGVNPVYMHRILSISSLTIDSLPHAAGQYVHLGLLGMTQRDCYRHTFRLTVVHTTIVCVVMTAVVVLFLG